MRGHPLLFSESTGNILLKLVRLNSIDERRIQARGPPYNDR